MKKYQCKEDYIFNGELCFTRGRTYREDSTLAANGENIGEFGYIRFRDNQNDIHDLSFHIVEQQFIEVPKFNYGK